MKRAVLYLRVSTTDQTTANQERELREVASRMGCEIVRVYKDHGIGFIRLRRRQRLRRSVALKAGTGGLNLTDCCAMPPSASTTW